MSICYKCFKKYTTSGPCPHCGYDVAEQAEKYPHALRPGTILGGKYILGRVLGQGGFGITYAAQDYDTKKTVAIKEHFPTSFVTRSGSLVSVLSAQHAENFAAGKELFLAEAKTISQFNGQSNICDIYSYFEENGTAYFAMEYVQGQELDKYIKAKGGRLSFDEARSLLLPVMRALGNVHAKGIIHRDISPDNIMVTPDGNTMLIDFGAARYSMGEKSRSLDVILKHGFAPKEQYTRHGKQGPYTDVYAMAATFYYALTGRVPPEAIDRISNEELILPSTLGSDISEGAEDVLLYALNVEAAERYQSMWSFAEALQLEKHSAGHANSKKINAPSVSALMHRANLYLESGDWKQAAEFYEHALSANPELGEAYLGKLLAELHLSRVEQLKDCRRSYSKRPNFTLAHRFASPELRAQLEEYAAAATQTVASPKQINLKPFVKQLNNKKKLIIPAAAAILLLLILILPGAKKDPKETRVSSASAAESVKPTENPIAWNLSEDGVLTISGTGPMEDYEEYRSAPWHNNMDAVRSIVISDGITSIGKRSFMSLENATKLTLPDSIESINEDAFAMCCSLESVKLPKNLVEIGSYAFYCCEEISYIEFPDGLKRIGSNAFHDCWRLETVALPDSVEHIDASAFLGCDALKTIKYAGSKSDWKDINIGTNNDPLLDAWKAANPDPTPTPSPSPKPTPAPKPQLKKTLLYGQWGEREPVKNGNYAPYVLTPAETGCSKLYMDLAVESYTGYPFGDWYLYAKDSSGEWFNAGSFRIEEAAADGKTREYVFEYNTPIDIQALTICTASKYAEFDLIWYIDFYVDKWS